MRKDVLKRLVYAEGFHKVQAELLELKQTDMTRREMENEVRSRYGHRFDLSKMQIASWWAYFEIGPSSYKRNNTHAVDVIVRAHRGSLKELLTQLYIEELLSSRKIAEQLSDQFDVKVSPAQVQRWLKLCDVEIRSNTEHVALRWSDSEERQKASDKTRAYFETPEGQEQKIALSEWNARVWGKTHAVSKLEVHFKDTFLAEVAHTYQKQFRLKNRKLIVADFYVDGKVIEVNGDYWHAHPHRFPDAGKDTRVANRLARDKIKHQYYVDNNIPVVYIWESDIWKRPELVRELVKQFLKGEPLQSINSYECH